MIPVEWIARLRGLAEYNRVPIAAAPDRINPVETLVSGQRVEARIVHPLPDDRYLVEFDGRRATAVLGKGLQPGTVVSLLVDRAGPPPVLRAVPVPANAATTESAIELSATSRLASTLAQVGGAPHDITVRAAEPVLAQAPRSAAGVPEALKRALAMSGLFYESHLAEWAAGERTLDDVIAESLTRQASRLPGAMPEKQASLGGDREGGPAAARPLPAPPPPDAAQSPVAPIETRLDADGAALVRSQLHAIEHRHVAWHGQLFTGQWMEWDIAELPDDSGTPGTPSSWHTRVAIDLPRLGRVLAVLHLGPAGLGVALETEHDATARELADGIVDLRAALGAAGLKVSAIAEPLHAAR